MDNFVPLADLRSAADMKADPFFKNIVKAHTSADGEDVDLDVYRRLQNPNCLTCQNEYRAKYPDMVFKPKCHGIFDEQNFSDQAEWAGSTMQEAAEFLDVETWMESYIVIADKDGNFHPYSSKDRPYQKPVLQCTAQFQVDRMGRGLGKTTLAIGTELHKAVNHKNFPILVLCPGKAQAQLWYEEIMKQFDNSPMLKNSLKRSIQAPYFMFQLTNGSTIKIFTAGSKAGRGAAAIRSQSPRRVRLDEQDFLAEADYDAVMALLRRFPESEFHGSSTPTGARSMYWMMCTQLAEYKEFYVPVTVRPNWDREMEMTLREECKTSDRYNHEYLALFGDLTQGVFKGATIDKAKKNYAYAEILYDASMMQVASVNWKDCTYNPERHYVLGCDWNGYGTGTRIRVTEFNPITKMRRCVYMETIDLEDSMTEISLEHIKLLNRVWHCDYIFCDKGFAFVQDEMLRKMGVIPLPQPGYPDTPHAIDDRKLAKANFVGSKENLVTNRLVPKRDPNSAYIEDKELKRQTKPFMIEGCQIAMEQSHVEISNEDKRLEAQMRDYRVKTYSANGQAQSYEAKTEGDHDFDAWTLSMLGIELNFGLFFDAKAHQALASVSHLSSFGKGLDDKIAAVRARMVHTSIPNRVQQPNKQEDMEVLFANRDGAIISPGRGSSAPGGNTTVSSRTSMFRAAPSRGLGPTSARSMGARGYSGRTPF